MSLDPFSLQTQVISYSLTEFILNYANNAKHSQTSNFGESLLSNWVRFANKYFQSVPSYNALSYKAKTLHKQYQKYFKGKRKQKNRNQTKSRQEINTFKHELDSLLRQLFINPTNRAEIQTSKFNTIPEWFSFLQNVLLSPHMREKTDNNKFQHKNSNKAPQNSSESQNKSNNRKRKFSETVNKVCFNLIFVFTFTEYEFIIDTCLYITFQNSNDKTINLSLSVKRQRLSNKLQSWFFRQKCKDKYQ